MSEEVMWELVGEVYSRLEADMIESHLKALEIPCLLIQESAGHSVYPVNLGALGKVEIYVPAENAEEVKTLLHSFNAATPEEGEDSEEEAG